jgi:xanthine dehydrogenase YagT iron-sulfur-binding subunit
MRLDQDRRLIERLAFPHCPAPFNESWAESANDSPVQLSERVGWPDRIGRHFMDARISLQIDGTERSLTADTRTTLLDLLRDRLGVISTKKGCDHGQCGACTVLLDGRRVTTCLSLAVACDGSTIITAQGLAAGSALHKVQQAFLDHDGFQCGYCTPGQICSAVGMFGEAKAGHPSHVTKDLTGPVELTDEEIRERMSGNLCRCGAYVNIVAAIREAAL